MTEATGSAQYQAIARISLSNLQNNLSVSRETAGDARRLVIVKSAFYGHFLDPVVETIDQQLEPHDVLGVTNLERAITLRNKLPTRRLLLLHGIFDETELKQSIVANLELVVHHIKQVELLLKNALSAMPLVWIKVDSGMNRLGFNKEQAEQYAPMIAKLKPHCLLSHFACADEPSHPLNNQQKACFTMYKKLFSDIPYTSVANSAAIINSQQPFMEKEYIRPGIMTYGISPNERPHNSRWEKRLRPICSLFAPVISIKEIKKGSFVGYGAIWTAPEDGWLAVLKIGYADGYPRILSSDPLNPLWVFLKGKKRLVVGRISMDLTTVYIAAYREGDKMVKIGDMAELWGKNISLYDIAKKASTIPYELLTGLSARVKRIVENDDMLPNKQPQKNYNL